MAFCTSCGNILDPNSQFCTKCGARQAVGVGGGAAAAPAPSTGSSAVKIVLIVVAGLCILGLVGTIASVLIVRNIARRSHVQVDQRTGEARVETPFGTVETTKDPAKIAQNLGVDVYPGARAIQGGSNVQAMGMHTVTGIFETDDPIDKVSDFYRNKYPNAMYSVKGSEHSIITGDQGSMLTIHVQEQGGNTKITIVNMAGKGIHPPKAPDVPEPPEPPSPPTRQTN